VLLQKEELPDNKQGEYLREVIEKNKFRAEFKEKLKGIL
jgi:hypothetical protein